MEMNRRQRFEVIKADPETPDIIYRHMANGGSLITYCEMMNVDFCDVTKWLNAEHMEVFNNANEALRQWEIHRLLQEIKAISFVDIRKIFNEDHSLKSPSEWPDNIASALAGIDVAEIWDNEADADGKKHKVQIGEIKKIKLFDKLKALEMLGKDLGRFVTKHEVSGKLTLEELVTGSKKEK